MMHELFLTVSSSVQYIIELDITTYIFYYYGCVDYFCNDIFMGANKYYQLNVFLCVVLFA